MKAPEILETSRLILRRPDVSDAEAIFQRYASDPEVTRYLSWPTHRSVHETIAFCKHSDEEWGRSPAGPYLIEDRHWHGLLGGTGLAFTDPAVATTGYVLAKDAWNQGFATEALTAVVELAISLGVRRLTANCHLEHLRSQRVLDKCGFVIEDRCECTFPNLDGDDRAVCLRFTASL